ncbi:MAG: hypothetical protein ACM3ZE_17810, partial [Myxococcales bacterium]
MSSPLSPASSPLSPVDAEDLAQSLDSLLEVIPKNCMGELCRRATRSEQLIARYHAQQADTCKRLLASHHARKAYLRQQALAVRQIAEELSKPDSDGFTMDVY